MIHVVWEFVVRPSAIDAFQRAYRPNGVWCRLFQSYPGYCGTILLRDRRNPRRFITVDVWARDSDRERMLTAGYRRGHGAGERPEARATKFFAAWWRLIKLTEATIQRSTRSSRLVRRLSLFEVRD